jgi:flagellar basal-body rod protein FlgB
MEVQPEPTQLMLTRLLDATALRHRVLTHNLANAETPNFIRKDVAFEAELAEAVKTDELSAYAPRVTEDRVTPVRADGNNVALDSELAEINKNALLHQLAIQLMQTKLAMQRIAITGRS